MKSVQRDKASVTDAFSAATGLQSASAPAWCGTWLTVSAGAAAHALLPACACADMTWLEGDAHAEMYERAGFLSTEDGGINVLAGSTLGGGEAAAPFGVRRATV
jgi:hypothetical protein